MSHIAFEFPVIVQTVKVGDQLAYHIKPLFLNYPEASHQRFEIAINNFKKELRTRFKGFVLNSDNRNFLLWYKFNPKLKFKTVKLEFETGKQFFSEKFSFALFSVKEHQFAILPAFDNHILLIKKTEKGKPDYKGQVKEYIVQHLKEIRKETGEKIEIENYAASKNSFVTSIEINLNIKYENLKLKDELPAFFFSSAGNNENFDGWVELNKVGRDLNLDYPSELRRAYHCEEIVNRVYNIIYQVHNTPIVLLGKEGVGKSSIIEEVVFRYQRKNRNKNFQDQERMWWVDPTRIIAGMSIVGMWQKRFESILNHLLERSKELKLKSDKMVISNIVAMLRIGKSAQNNMTLSDVLKPYLEKRLLQIIMIATPDEWKVLQEQDRRFADLFQVVRVSEPDVETAVKMVAEQRKHIELDYSCQINSMAIPQLFSIHRNYWKHRSLPGSIIDLMRQLANKYKYRSIDAHEIRTEFEATSGLQLEIFDDTYLLDSTELRKEISRNLVGQEAAVDCLANVIHTVKAKLNDPNKPFGSFLFIGPTGVGKTQAAKVLCNFLTGNKEQLIRFDMNEYIDAYAVDRLIGDSMNPQGQLTGAVRYKPFGIILFDEIEKAHPKVHDLLLQVLDDGRLTDSQGRTVDFTNTIIIMTSNVGAQDAKAKVGFSSSNEEEALIFQKAVERNFRPEFVNRIDQIVIFNPLELSHIYKIANLQIKELLSRDGFVRRTTLLNVSQDALKWVAERGFNSRMGGRALKRQIERDLTALSAEQLISHYSDRPILFEIKLKDGKLFPVITPLDFVEELPSDWLPVMPIDHKGKRFYRNLLRDLDYLEDQLPRDHSVLINTVDLDRDTIHVYALRDSFDEMRERFKRQELGFGHDIIEGNQIIPMRLKRVRGSSFVANNEGSEKAVREMNKDKYFQKEGLEELKNAYKFGQNQFDKTKSSYFNDFLNFEFLFAFTKGFLTDDLEEIEVQFTSYISNLGKGEIQHLIEIYERLAEDLGIEYKVNKKQGRLILKGFNISEIFSGEQGIHLFYITHQSPIPIKLTLRKNGILLKDSYKIVRVYNGSDTLTDIRSGYTTDINLTALELKLLVFAGMPKVAERRFSQT